MNRLVEVDRVGETRYLFAGSDRIVDDAGHWRFAAQVPDVPLLTARKLGEGSDAGWYFVTAAGALLRAVDFDGDLEAVDVMTERPAADLVDAVGALAVQTASGSSLWIFEPSTGGHVVSASSGLLIDAAVHWPDAILLFAEPGVAQLSRDGGETFDVLDLGGRIPSSLGADATGVYVSWSDDTISRVASDGSLASADAPARAQTVPSGEAWCSGMLPLAVRARWPADEMLPSTPAQLTLPARACAGWSGREHVLAFCGEEDGSTTVHRLDPTTRTFTRIAALADTEWARVFSIADAPGSSTFVVSYSDRSSTSHALFFDGSTSAPVTGDTYLDSVYGDRAIADHGVHRLPGLEPIDLALPAGASPRALAFTPDGTLLVVVDGADGAMFVGAPGAWVERSLPTADAEVRMADALHGIASAQTGFYATLDGAQTWAPLAGFDAFGSHDIDCIEQGCIGGGRFTLRPQPTPAERVAFETEMADVPESTQWTYATEPRWRCEPPSTASRTPLADEIASSPWGVIAPSFLPAGATRLTWSGVDARGAYRSIGSAPDGANDWGRPAAITRRFATAVRRGFVDVASASPHSIDLATVAPSIGPSLDDHADSLVLADGSALVLVASRHGGEGTRRELLLFLDADGALRGSQAYAWRDDPNRRWAIAAGPFGTVGRAFTTEELSWRVTPIGGSDAIALVAPLSEAPCTAASAVWTLGIADGPREFAWGTTGASALDIVQVADDQACLAAVLPGQLIGDDVRSLPFAFAANGSVHGTALDGSPHGRPMTCTLDDD